MSSVNPCLSIMGLVTDDPSTSADFDCEQLESQNLPRCMHSKEISEAIAAALTDPINFTENELNRLIQFMNIYLENPTLLDSFLGDWIHQISQKLLEFIKNCSDPAAFTVPCTILYNFSKIRGYKSILKYFPNSIPDSVTILCKTLLILQEEDDSSNWTCRYIFILWMSLLIQNPFPLNRLFSKNLKELSDFKSLLKDKFLKSSGKEMQAASICLANYFKRSDCEDELKEFFIWCKNSILSDEYALGIATCLIQLGKRADDSTLLKFIEDFSEITEIFQSKSKSKSKSTPSTFEEKLLVKLNGKLIEMKLKMKNCDLKVDLTGILSSLRCRDTVVRWTTAKTIRRICFQNGETIQNLVFNFLLSELEKEFASSASLSAIELSPFYIHALLLSIGQLFNYKIFPNEYETETKRELFINLITNCLRFEQIKGSYSIGSFVRDAACYVIWSLARYSTHILEAENVRKIIFSLTFMSLFDREVSCRRSASAALQEFIGRLSGGGETETQKEKGAFLEILKHSDFFSVSSLEKCFYSNSICIAKAFPEIIPFFTENLLTISLFSFDKNIRQMSAKTIGILSNYSNQTIDRVIEIFEKSNDLFAIHGALLTMAALPFDSNVMKISCKSNTIPLKSLGYDLLLVGYLKLIESYAHFGCDDSEIISCWLQTILTGLKSKQDETRQSAVSTLSAVSQLPLHHSQLIETFYLSIMSGIDLERDISTQKGYLAALSTVPKDVFSKNGSTIIKLLIKISKTILPINDIEKRCSAIDSLVILCTYYKDDLNLSDDLNQIKDILINSLLCDYSIDTRGDVGSKIRLSAIKLSEAISLKSCPEMKSLLYEQIFGRLDRLKAPAMAALSLNYETVQLEDLAQQLFTSNQIVAFSGAFRGLIYSCGGLDRELSTISLNIIQTGINTGESVYKIFKMTSFNCIQASGDQRLSIPAIITVSKLIQADSSILPFEYLEEFAEILVSHVLESSSNIRKLIPSFTLLIAINPLLNGKYSEYLETQGNTHKFPTIRQLIKQ